MRKIYYHFSLFAGFLLCLISSFALMKGRSSAANAAEASATAQQQETKQIASPPNTASLQEPSCRRRLFAENSFIICRVNPAHNTIKLFLADQHGKAYQYFRNIRAMLEKQGQKAVFLMNAGMYHKDYSPVGLYIENGIQLYPVSTSSGKGNFFMKPNGVFYITGDKAGVSATEAFLKAGIAPRCATQSGPMLVIDNHIHPKFIPHSSFREYRNGVGVTAQGDVFFAISEQKINFYDFAQMFRDKLHTPNALFLDGSISSIYAPDVSRADWFYPMGPIIGVTAPAH